MVTRKKKDQGVPFTYKFRIYPTKMQEDRLNISINVCRLIYNELIAESRLDYKEGYKVNIDELQRMIPLMIPLMIPEETPLYSKAGQMVLQQFYNNISVLSAKAKKGKG